MSRRTIPPTSPSQLILTTLNDPAGRFDAYWPRLEAVDVQTPETVILPLDTDPPVTWDTSRIKQVMDEHGWDKAFVRGMQKAAPHGLAKGSFIDAPTEDEIDRTLNAFVRQFEQSVWKHCGKIAVRERLDLDYCLNPTHAMCHPEVRFFIEDGDLLFSVPDTVSPDMVCDQQYDYLTAVLQEASLPVDAAQCVADEFTERSWAVDFVLTAQGEWYCVELNLNAVRYDDDRGWVNTCGHGEMVAYSPQVVHEPVLTMVERVF